MKQIKLISFFISFCVLLFVVYKLSFSPFENGNLKDSKKQELVKYDASGDEVQGNFEDIRKPNKKTTKKPIIMNKDCIDFINKQKVISKIER